MKELAGPVKSCKVNGVVAAMLLVAPDAGGIGAEPMQALPSAFAEAPKPFLVVGIASPKQKALLLATACLVAAAADEPKLKAGPVAGLGVGVDPAPKRNGML